MTLLAIDTSGSYASVALYDGERVLAEATWYARRHHDDELFPSIERQTALAGVARASIDRIAVALGPGSFTGLRVGIAAAQGMARASGAGLVGVPTLDAIAHPFRQGRVRVCALVPAGRGEHHFAMYRERSGRWVRVSAVATASAAEIARRVALDTLFAGEIDDATEVELRERLGPRASFASRSGSARRAGHLAELGWDRAEAGELVAPEALAPLYVRLPSIRGPRGQLLDEAATASLLEAGA